MGVGVGGGIAKNREGYLLKAINGHAKSLLPNDPGR